MLKKDESSHILNFIEKEPICLLFDEVSFVVKHEAPELMIPVLIAFEFIEKYNPYNDSTKSTECMISEILKIEQNVVKSALNNLYVNGIIWRKF